MDVEFHTFKECHPVEIKLKNSITKLSAILKHKPFIALVFSTEERVIPLNLSVPIKCETVTVSQHQKYQLLLLFTSCSQPAVICQNACSPHTSVFERTQTQTRLGSNLSSDL